MSGGLHSKLGDWYEQDYVCLLWMQLLGEGIQSVEWEPRDADDESGVDAWTVKDGRRIAFQVKKRGTGSWSLSALRASGILENARFQIERKDGASEFHFVTTASAPDLEGLISWAVEKRPLEDLTKKMGPVAEALLGEPASVDNEPRLRNLAGRLRVVGINRYALQEVLRHLARDLLGDDGERLVQALLALRETKDLGKKWQLGELRQRLEVENFSWRHSVDPSSLLERVEEFRRDFVEEITSNRTGTCIERPEQEELLGRMLSCKGGETFLVHGAQGTGKSDLIAMAVAAWPSERGIIVPFLADDAERLEEQGVTPSKLLLAVGPGRVAFVVDQLDQLMLAGRDTQRRLRRVTRLVRKARELGCLVIVGCRTVDAHDDTQLHKILEGGTGRERAPSFEVKGLPESLVTTQLANAGITWTSLGPDVRRLVLTPLCLRFAIDLAEQDGWQGSRSLHELVVRWWTAIAAGDPARQAALDALIDRMESEGIFAIDKHRLSEHDEALTALERSGALRLDSRSRWKPVHQVLIDMRLAQRLGDSADEQELLRHLGTRENQDVHRARQLRHAVTILANRDAGGAEIVDGLFRSDDVRPLLKRGLLLGLAGESEPRSTLASVVLRWLEQPEWVELVSDTLLRRNGPWMSACKPWLEANWTAADNKGRGKLMHLLASVADCRGDLVAELLTEWAQSGEDVLERARWIFTQDPLEDTDELFELRLQAVRESILEHRAYRWPELLKGAPVRAARLVGAILTNVTSDHASSSNYGNLWLPESSQFPETALIAADRFWSEAREWWQALEIEDLRSIETSMTDRRSAPLVDLVEILARCQARLCNEGQLSWGDLLGQLPSPLRDLDGWLLLEAGARLDGRTSKAVEDSAAWLYGEGRFAQLRVGRLGPRSEPNLVQGFATAMGLHLSDAGLLAFESWTLNHKDSWSPDDERYRFDRGRRYGTLLPNDRGLRAHLVLGSLPEDRLSPEAKRRLAEFRRKFDAHREWMLAAPSSVGGWVQSAVPDKALENQSGEQWVERLRQAPTSSVHMKQVDANRVSVYDRKTLFCQLEGLARKAPRDYLKVAEDLAAAEPPFEDEHYSALLWVLGETTSPGGKPGEPEWQQASDSEIARLIQLPAFLNNAACAAGLGRIVGQRGSYDWPGTVTGRLIEIGEGPVEDVEVSDRFARPDEDPLDHLLLNDAACLALRALAVIASQHVERQSSLLDVAERLIAGNPPARRVAAAVLALCCSGSDGERAHELFFRGCEDEQVAGNRNCDRRLFALAISRDLEPGVPARAKAVLLGLAKSSSARLARTGGHAAVALCLRGELASKELSELLLANPQARRGAAEELGASLSQGDREAWVGELAVLLADDKQDGVGDVILRHALQNSQQGSLEMDGLPALLIGTEAGRRAADQLLDALDEQANLEPAAAFIFKTAERVLGDPAGARDAFAQYSERRSLSGLLARLVEECERTGNHKLREQALDLWDRHLLARPTEDSSLIERITA